MCVMKNITKSLAICLATILSITILVNGQMHYCQKIQSETLRKISFDQKLNRLFVASTNKVLELHPNNFSIINEQSLVQKLESGDCGVGLGCDITGGQQNFNTQVLLVDAENLNLIVCGSANRGSCYIIALDGLTISDKEIQWIVSTDEKDRVHANIYGHLTEPVQQVIIGNSVLPKAGGLSQLKFVYGFEPSTFEMDISLPYSEQFLLDSLSIDVVGSFKHKGHTFLIVNRQTTKGGDQISYLVRICDRNPTSESLVEVRLGCSADGKNDEPFIAVGLEKTFLSDELAKVQRIVAEDALFVLFGNKTSSAICVYSLDEIMETFKNVVEGCIKGQAGFEIGAFYVTGEPSRTCQPVTSSVNPQNFCGEAPLNFPMGSSSTAIRNSAIASYFPLDVVTTSFLVTVVNEYNVAFVATDRQSVIKVKMPSSPQSPSAPPSSSHVEFVLPLESQIREMAFDGSEGFFVMGEKSLCYMKRAVCNHTTCESCIVDPYCGWCLETKKCMQKASCPNHHLWMSDKCPTVLNLVPRNVPLDDFRNRKIRMEVSNVPKNYAKGYCNISVVPDPAKPSTYSKQVDIFKVDTSHTDSLGFICKEFNDRPNVLNGKAFSSMTLTIVLDNVSWVSDNLYIYDCKSFKSCSSCVSEEMRFPCNWCIDSLTCIPDDDRKCNLRQFADADSPLVIRSDKCPSVDSCNSTQVFSSGSSVSYQMMGRNIKEHYKSGLSCRFGMDSAIDQPSASVLPSENPCNIFCSQTMLKYEAPKPFQVVNVDLVVDSNSLDPKVVDNQNNVTLTLFKCRYMESSCGKCLLLDPTYECVWCKKGEYCGSKSECPSDNLDKGSICPNPTIASFQPIGGPILGGTRLTIRGTNLGMSASQVQVTLGSRECKVLPELYQATEVIVCNTSSAIRPELSKVEVKVNNMHSCTSSTDFQYKNPQLKDFKPNRGMKSGGTLVAIVGQNLDFGSRYVVTIGEKRSTVISRNATHLMVITAENSIPKKVSVKVKVDNFDMEALPSKFEYLNNPDITGIRPKSSLLSGGRQLTVTGRSFEIISNAQFVSTFAFTNFTTACTVKSSTSMTCPSPDMRDLEHYFNDQTSNSGTVGFVLDNVSFPFDKDYLTYYYDPIIRKFNRVQEVKDSYQDVCIETEKSEWLTEFLSDIKVNVGSVNCSHSSFGTDTNSICFKPVECPVRHHGEREYPVKVMINNFSEEVGRIKYPASFRSGLVIGLILGLLIPIIIAAIIFVLWYAKRIKRLNIKKREGQMLTSNQPPSQTRNQFNRYAGEPATSTEEAIPLTEVVDPNAYQDDAQYLEALINRLDNQNRNAAKEVYIARERLEIGNQLGKGHFGCVYAATLRDVELRNPMPVAVKTIDDTDLDQKMMESFLKEGIVMKNFNHPHVLSLLGLCLGYKKEPMVILPFMANGDLRSYIKAKNRSFTARQLLQLAQQVAEGMSYLASLNFIHRDLAARNCMIDDKSQVKVADFGLSHELHDREYYSSRNRRAKLPIKWMALESLENYVFTIKSDVWSFGVLLWELMTRGTTPYPDVDVFETRNFLASGRRLHKPKFCPDNVYALMMDCWQESPERRPTFTDLVNRIELLLNPPRYNPSSDKNERSYINIPSHDPIQDYLKPISSPPEDERNRQESAMPNQDGDDHDDTSSLSSHGSEESIEAPKVLQKAGIRVKEASV